jgi:hypothetical protein
MKKKGKTLKDLIHATARRTAVKWALIEEVSKTWNAPD